MMKMMKLIKIKLQMIEIVNNYYNNKNYSNKTLVKWKNTFKINNKDRIKNNKINVLKN